MRQQFPTPYASAGFEAANSFDIGYAPDFTETLSFKWEGKDYEYKGDARVILLAISPANRPVLVAPADDRTWDWNHDYYCASPHYVQLVPDASGRNWTWPPQIEPWLYGMPGNLMRNREKPEEMLARYTERQRQEADLIEAHQSPTRARIDPTHTVTDCMKRN